jgi:hypothetical protein
MESSSFSARLAGPIPPPSPSTINSPNYPLAAFTAPPSISCRARMNMRFPANHTHLCCQALPRFPCRSLPPKLPVTVARETSIVKPAD